MLGEGGGIPIRPHLQIPKLLLKHLVLSLEHIDIATPGTINVRMVLREVSIATFMLPGGSDQAT